MKGSETEVSSPDHVQAARGQTASGVLSGRLPSQLYGAGILLVTTVLWASGGPTTKYLFLLPTPPSAALLTACTSFITALFLGVGLLGHALDAGARGSRRPAAAAASAAAASVCGTAAAAATAAQTALGSTAAAEPTPSPSPQRGLAAVALGPDEVEAEALLHSGMHTTGAAGGALAAAWAAGKLAAQQQQREQAWARAQECALPLLPSHGSHYYSSLPSYSLATDLPSDSVLRRAEPEGMPSWEISATERLLGSPLPSFEAGPSGKYEVSISSGGGHGAVLQGSPNVQADACRVPSKDGTAASPAAAAASPPLPLRPYTGANLVRLSSSGGGASSGAPRRRSIGDGGGAAPRPGQLRLQLLTAPARSLPAAGFELGIYSVTAAALGAWGMQRISATRSAFLTQATSLLTPLLVWLSGGCVGLVVWLACCCGAIGGFMVALDNVYGTASAAADAGGGRSRYLLFLFPMEVGSGDGNLAGGFGRRMLLSAETAAAAVGGGSRGDGGWQVEGVFLTRQAMGAVYVLLSCVFWGLGTVRLGVHSARYPPLNLAAAAAMSYAGLSLLWLLSEIIGSPSAGLSVFLELRLLVRDHVTAALLLWAGLGPGALSSYLQVLGQQTVPPAQAQVLFSSTPLWSALIAQLLLPGEAMGPLAWLGGGVMLAASLLASLWQ